MLHAMPWCLRSMFSSEQQENSHIIMIKILTCHMNYKICHLSARSHIAQSSLFLQCHCIFSWFFYKRKNIDSSIFIKLLVRSIWCFLQRFLQTRSTQLTCPDKFQKMVRCSSRANPTAEIFFYTKSTRISEWYQSQQDNLSRFSF